MIQPGMTLEMYNKEWWTVESVEEWPGGKRIVHFTNGKEGEYCRKKSVNIRIEKT